MHFISGWILWGAWAAYFFEDFDKSTGGNVGKFIVEHFDGQMLACVYSLFYNALYMIPEMIITVVLAILVGKIPQISKELK
jgi:thiamine transporter ThiT